MHEGSGTTPHPRRPVPFKSPSWSNILRSLNDRLPASPRSVTNKVGCPSSMPPEPTDKPPTPPPAVVGRLSGGGGPDEPRSSLREKERLRPK